MTTADVSVFTAQLVGLQELLGGPAFSETKLLLYCEAVSDLPIETLLEAVREAARTATFFPKPSELRALACGDTPDAVEHSWLLFKTAMRQQGAYASLVTIDPALGATIDAMFGGWPQACGAEFSPEMWAAKRKEFERVYGVFAQRGLVGPRYLPGTIELQNGGRAEWARFTKLAVIGPQRVTALEGARAEAFRATLAAAPAPEEPADTHGWALVGRDDPPQDDPEEAFAPAALAVVGGQRGRTR